MMSLKILTIGIALGIDAFVVAVAAGVSLKKVNLRQTFRLSWHFGFFQGMMPIIGWFLGISVHSYTEHLSHWIGFFLLIAVGMKMIWEALSFSEESENNKIDPTRGKTMVLLSVATSIDALAVGFSLSVMRVDIVIAAVIIGFVAMVMTALGMHLGKQVGKLPKFSLVSELLAGIVLILIGFHMLYDAGVFTP